MGRKQDQKPDRKLGARPRPHMNYPVSQGHHFSVKCRLATGNRNPPTIKTKNQHDHIILQGHCTTPPTSQLSTFPVCAGQQILYTTTLTPRPRHLPLGPCCQQIPTGVVTIIELHGLTYDILGSTWDRSKVTHHWGHAHLNGSAIYLRMCTNTGPLCNA